MMKLSPYLLFDGECERAMRFYHAKLGGELSLAKVSGSPLKNQMPPHMQEKVLNARLVGAGFEISASDWMRAGQSPVRGNTTCLYFNGGTRNDIHDIFEKLSDGAEITDPLQEMPIGIYGALNDKFGVRWMFHAD